VSAPDDLNERASAVRRFNRFYTPIVGLLNEAYLDSPFSVAQVRVLYELAHRARATAVDLARDLALDQAYLSRILRGFAEVGLIERRRSAADGRLNIISLTKQGRAVFEPLDRRSQEEVSELLAELTPSDGQQLVSAMALIERVLSKRRRASAGFVLRPPRAGDFGWIVQRHGGLYSQEYGWDDTFEALVAEIVAAYVRKHNPERERAWIAEMDGQNVGCVLCISKSDEVAQLRLLLVERHARGLGLGSHLVEECVRFARSVGYRRLMLWTNDVLDSARRIYEAAGFRLVEEEHHRSFGADLVGQNWELEL
jgi:DNA-binding MarR family transcriptional regulator/GNAT superfamily N-acetyltransferase